MDITVIIPYYRNPEMLCVQLEAWSRYPDSYRFIVVDDCSPEPAEPAVRKFTEHLGDRIRLFRIKKDIPWNAGGARNLGSFLCETDWLLHLDIDHVLPVDAAEKLVDVNVNPQKWYKFDRFRIGAADFTRKKDSIPPEAGFGKIKPHINSYLCSRTLFWAAGGYDEDYSGSIGGATPFLKQLARVGGGKAEILTEPLRLWVFTTNAIRDASDIHLSRDNSRYVELYKKKGDTPAKNPIRFEWEAVEL